MGWGGWDSITYTCSVRDMGFTTAEAMRTPRALTEQSALNPRPSTGPENLYRC